MKIILTEKQLDKVLDNVEVIEEQNVQGEDQRTLIVLLNKINDIIDKKEKEILDKTGVKVISEGERVILKIGNKSYEMKLMMPGVYAVIIPPRSILSFDGASMKTIFPLIEKIPEYKILVEKYPEIADQIQSLPLRGMIFTDEQNQGEIKMTVTKKLLDKKDVRNAVPLGTEYPLGEFFQRNRLIYRFIDSGTKEVRFATIETGQLQMNLASANIKLPTPVATTQQNVASGSVPVRTLELQDLFNYDTAEFQNADAVNSLVGQYIQEMKKNIQDFGESFIKGYIAKGPTVFGYSSRDADPNQQINGGYGACSGKRTRFEYDMCLSEQRAKVIADLLNKSLPELNGAIKYKGMGQTTHWGPGWTKEKPTIPEQTAPNRKFILPGTTVNVPTPQQQPQQPQK